MKIKRISPPAILCVIVLIASVVACAPASTGQNTTGELTSIPPTPSVAPSPTSLPTRPIYSAGQLVDYTVQSGDTLPALAAHFNTTEDEIRFNNFVLPETTTTLPQGLPLKIPIYYRSFWGSSFQIIPDDAFVNGPGVIGFDTQAFVNGFPGWLKDYRIYAGDAWRSGPEIIDTVASDFSISPRLLLALVEYQAQGLTSKTISVDHDYPLGYEDEYHQGLYLQLVWAANTLNNGYYGWRTGRLVVYEHKQGTLESPDPWQNAASVGLQYYFAQVMDQSEFSRAILGNGLVATYTQLFGDPWLVSQPLFPGSLEQPRMLFPFRLGSTWTYTGGPHTGWGEGDPLAALDFAPPAVVGGCQPSTEYATAVADGVIVRADSSIVVLDLDSDNDERTGWAVFYLHVAAEGMIAVGTAVHAGDLIGLPSCEGGSTTGTHIHIARKYNGEWVPADGALAFNLEGWTAFNGDQPYLGTLQKFGNIITACVCSNIQSQVQSLGQ
jgi:LasA protease